MQKKDNTSVIHAVLQLQNIENSRNKMKQVEVGNAKPIEPTVTKSTTTSCRTTAPQQVAEPPQQLLKKQLHNQVQQVQLVQLKEEQYLMKMQTRLELQSKLVVDSTQSMVLVITKNDGTEGSIPWSNIKKVGEVILLGNPDTPAEASQPGKCSNCGFGNKEGSKFCEECGTKL